MVQFNIKHDVFLLQASEKDGEIMGKATGRYFVDSSQISHLDLLLFYSDFEKVQADDERSIESLVRTIS